MENQKHIELDVTIVGSNITNRELDKLRAELYTKIADDLSGEDVKMYQETGSRVVDPAIIGTISLVLLPIVMEKVGDSLIEYFKSLINKDSSVKLSVPPLGDITYNPHTTSPEELKSWIDAMRQALQADANAESEES